MRSPTAALLLLAIACQSERDVSWDEIAGKPTSFPTTWPDVAEKPTTYPTAWPEIAGAPATFPSSWDETVGKPLTFPTTWSEILDRPASFPSSWDDVAGKPATFPASWSDLTGVPTSFPAEWSAVANRPAAFPTEWALVAGKPAAYPTDPALVQARVAGACAGGTAISAVAQDGSVTCAAAGGGAAPRPVTVQLPPSTWAAFQCASVSNAGGLAGLALPGLRFDPAGACGTGRRANTAIAIPAELADGPRPFRVRAIVSTLDVLAPVTLSLQWRIATAGAGSGAFSCFGSRAVTVPQLPSVQATADVEFDFTADPALCGVPGDPLVLMLERTDAAASGVYVYALQAVFE